MFGIGWMELLVLGLVAVLIFGKRLPEVGRNLGKGLIEFKKGLSGIEDDVTKVGQSGGASGGASGGGDISGGNATRQLDRDAAGGSGPTVPHDKSTGA